MDNCPRFGLEDLAEGGSTDADRVRFAFSAVFRVNPMQEKAALEALAGKKQSRYADGKRNPWIGATIRSATCIAGRA